MSETKATSQQPLRYEVPLHYVAQVYHQKARKVTYWHVMTILTNLHNTDIETQP